MLPPLCRRVRGTSLRSSLVYWATPSSGCVRQRCCVSHAHLASPSAQHAHVACSMQHAHAHCVPAAGRVLLESCGGVAGGGRVGRRVGTQLHRLRRAVKRLAGTPCVARGILAAGAPPTPPAGYPPGTAVRRWSFWRGRSNGCRSWWLARSSNARCTRPAVSSSKPQVRAGSGVAGPRSGVVGPRSGGSGATLRG